MNIIKLNTIGDIVKKVEGGSAPIANQSKVVGITENGTTTIKPDAGYTGLGMVKVDVNVPIVDLNYLTVEALEDGFTASFLGNDIEYRVGMNDDWHQLVNGDFTPSIKKGQIVSFRATLKPIENQGIGTFKFTQPCNLLGNVMSLIWGDKASSHVSLGNTSYTFYSLFQDCPIKDASRMVLPAADLTEYCYAYMFYGCYDLVSAPALPATNLKECCYFSMFLNCRNLINAPELPALTTVLDCYRNIFCNCYSLSYIKAMFTNDPTSTSTLTNWVRGVAPTGTFVKNSAATWDKFGESGVPNNWAIEYATE